MYLARVVGSAWATQKYEGMEGSKMLLVQALDKQMLPVGRPVVAVDTVDAGLGDLVFLVRAREASLALPVKGLPVDLAIVGVVDQVDAIASMNLDIAPGYTTYS
jgi:ethanolamine utilization protein EutN